MIELLTDSEVAVLNAARVVLAGLERRANDYTFKPEQDDRTWELIRRGRLAETAGAAGDALFHVLNTASSSDLATLTHEQLHMQAAI